MTFAQETQTCMSMESQRKLRTYSPTGRSAGTRTQSILSKQISKLRTNITMIPDEAGVLVMWPNWSPCAAWDNNVSIQTTMLTQTTFRIGANTDILLLVGGPVRLLLGGLGERAGQGGLAGPGQHGAGETLLGQTFLALGWHLAQPVGVAAPVAAAGQPGNLLSAPQLPLRC